MRHAFHTIVLGLASFAAVLTSAPSPSVAAAADRPARALIQPFPRAKQVEQSTRAYEDYWMALGRLTGEGQAERAEAIGGRWIHSAYLTPAGHTVAEVVRYYEKQIAMAGLEVVYSCRGTECGEGGRRNNGDWWPLSDHRGFLVARQQRPTGDLWVSVHVHSRLPKSPVRQEVDVIEASRPTPPPPPRDERDVATLEKELRADGRVVLRSVEFEDRHPRVTPGSEEVLGAVADLMTRHPELRLYVVVHDDDTGSARASLKETKKRAEAIVSLLNRQHGVSSKRLEAVGAGPYSPVASNSTEEGRAMNRRVVLVQQGLGRPGVAAVDAGGSRLR